MKYTQEEFCEKLNAKWPGKFEVLGRYDGAQAPLLVRCKSCGAEFTIPPVKLMQRGKCRQCRFNDQRMTTEQYRVKLDARFCGRFELLSEYHGCDRPVLVRCRVCGYEIEQNAAQFLYKGSCVRCFNRGMAKLHADYVAEIDAKYGGEYTVLGQYTKALAKILIRHNKCGREYWSAARSLLVGCGCPYCARERAGALYRMPQDEFQRRVAEMHGAEYEVLGQYVNRTTPILMRHTVCGFEWNTRPSNFLRGYQCPKCSRTGMSKIEQTVHDWLTEKGIPFKREVRFKECRMTGTLPFDFVVETPEGLVAIELDGPMHYEERYGTLLRIMMADRVKDDFCRSRGIVLLRVPYWEFPKAKQLIGKVLNQHGTAA